MGSEKDLMGARIGGSMGQSLGAGNEGTDRKKY